MTIMSERHGTIFSYTTGFLLSVVLTFIAFGLVYYRLLTGLSLEASIVVMAIAQALIQIFFFLHLAQERRPRWRLLSFFFMIMVICILVFGTLWIMHNLHYNMMMPK